MRFRSNSNLTADSIDGEGLLEHPVESRTRTAELPPVMVGRPVTFSKSPLLMLLQQNKVIDEDPISWLGFEEDCIITACANGHIRLWGRPQEAMSATRIDDNS